jgi:hypothetical protein
MISVGYFACHWCHVMQRESFQNTATAAWLNQYMVAVKVDRELRPALDSHLIAFVERTTGRAGWPLNVILTPDGLPLVGFTYLPNAQFLKVLQSVQQRWQAHPEALAALALRAHAKLTDERRAVPMVDVDAGHAKRLWQALLAQLMQAADPMSGGFGQQAKFPSVAQLDALLATEGEQGDRDNFLRFTLAQMASLGLRDQIAGGFFRYVTDPTWETPHFEKMLYDNALLADLYLRAGRQLSVPGFTAIGVDTLQFMVRELWDPRGGFIASLSAIDDEDVEGGYYLIDDLTLARLTRPERQLAAAAWGLEGAPALPAGHLARQMRMPNELAAELGIPLAQLQKQLRSLKSKLAAARERQSLPRGDKLLSAWNGMALSALANAPAAAGYAARARELASVLGTQMWDGVRLQRLLGAGALQPPGSLADYAYVARGLLDVAEALGDPKWAATSAAITASAMQRFFDVDAGGWRLADSDVIALGGATRAQTDRMLPAAHAVLLDTALRLSRRTDLPQGHNFRRDVGMAIARLEANVADEPFFYASHLALLAQFFEVADVSRR